MKIVIEYRKIGLVDDNNNMVASIKALALTNRLHFYKEGKIDRIEETPCVVEAMAMLLRCVPNLTVEDKVHLN